MPCYVCCLRRVLLCFFVCGAPGVAVAWGPIAVQGPIPLTPPTSLWSHEPVITCCTAWLLTRVLGNNTPRDTKGTPGHQTNMSGTQQPSCPKQTRATSTTGVGGSTTRAGWCANCSTHTPTHKNNTLAVLPLCPYPTSHQGCTAPAMSRAYTPCTHTGVAHPCHHSPSPPTPLPPQFPSSR